ncbi:serine--tRNA ligase [Nannocystis bainbridge]|uniref:Serine--tRNA ligase n=1 Tax=Nannocystis bainbridge TaxID=2995303 RepID=A0ABT5E0X5_9BACT|nr:serine--tRNA ligase [Nannocystis bainbridge]MDC0719532.1 serine--tRNA ligase [Nannocystis bainbridge]
MLDIHVLRDDSARIAQNLRDRHARVFEDLAPGSAADPAGADWAAQTVARLVDLDAAYLGLLRRQDELRQQQNQTSAAMKSVAALPKDQQAGERARLIEQGKQLRTDERSLVDQTEAALRARDEAWTRVPNLTHESTPRGRTDDDHRELRRVGTPRDFPAEGFAPRDHLAVAESLDLVDFEAGARVAGQKFYYLKHEAVLLDLALQHFALAVAARHGFTLHTTPDLAREEILRGLGFQPRGESTQVYSIADSDLCLVGTAEITLGGMLADAILEEEQLPLLLAGLSHCFRTEAGSSGQESKGLYRVHQFTKVELFAFTTPEQSEAMHERLLALEEEIFQALKIPYRVLDIASGDLGGPAFRKFDLEAWMPGRGAHGEITSTSNCTDYQARRLRIRYRPAGDGKPKPRHVHMLNGTAVATSRALVAILENYQQADGTVAVPEVLQPLVGKPVIGPRRRA